MGLNTKYKSIYMLHMDQYRAQWHVQIVAILFLILEDESVEIEPSIQFIHIQHPKIRLKHL